jgi:hypothetical protein
MPHCHRNSHSSDGDVRHLYKPRSTSKQTPRRAVSHTPLFSFFFASSPSRRGIVFSVMGNFGSCTLASVVLPDGRVRQVPLPATCAELMLEAPGHFLADARALRPGRRIEALAADEDLRRGALYAALPMKRLGAATAPADVARLAAAVVVCREKARRQGRRASSSAAATAKVAAVPGELANAVNPRTPRLDEMDVDDAAAAAEIEELKQRISGAGRPSRRPTLETIQEESYAC